MLKIAGVPSTIADRNLSVRRHIDPAQLKGVNINCILDDGDVLDLGSIELLVVHTPGHSPGHICLLDKERKILFSGDHILKFTTPNVVNLTNFLASLKRLLDIDIDLILPGHEAIIRQPKKRILDLIEYHHTRERFFFDLLYATRGKTLYTLASEYWGHILPYHLNLALREANAHIEKMRSEGKVTVEARKGVFYYKKA